MNNVSSFFFFFFFDFACCYLAFGPSAQCKDIFGAWTMAGGARDEGAGGREAGRGAFRSNMATFSQRTLGIERLRVEK